MFSTPKKLIDTTKAQIQIDKTELSDDRPDSELVLAKLKELSSDHLSSTEEFAKFIDKLRLHYVTEILRSQSAYPY